MRAQLARYWFAVRYSYWFVPTVMTSAAVLLSIVTTEIDRALDDGETRDLLWLALNTPEGARVLLSTIAGSMITVAGVTFSITIAAVVFATSQLGPRLLTNFLGDTSNQFSLGTFIATFVFGLLVLRTVQGTEQSAASDSFVPHIGVLVALILTLASLAVLIFYIHHIPRSIAASQVVAKLGADLNQRVKQLFPETLGAGPAETFDREPPPDELAREAWTDVISPRSGYLTQIDGVQLLSLAEEHDLVLRIVHAPGDFISAGAVLVAATGSGANSSLQAPIAQAFALENERTRSQDVLFVVQQLVEIAVRALSPGVNEPYTATNCMDWLGSALMNLGGRAMPSGLRYDQAGRLRVVAPAPTFAGIAAAAFDPLRPYASRDAVAALHMMATLERIVGRVDHPPYRDALLEHAAALQAGGEHGLAQARDRAALARAYRRLLCTCGGPACPEPPHPA